MNFTFFSSTQGTFSRIDHILGHKSSLGKFKKIEIIPSIFSDTQCSKIRSQLQEKNYLKIQHRRLKNMLLNNQQVKEEIKICIEMSENVNTTTQNLRDSGKAVLSVNFIAIQAYLKKQEKNQTNNLTLHLKQLEKK